MDPGGYTPDMLLLSRGDLVLFFNTLHSLSLNPLENIFGLNPGEETQHKSSPFSTSITITEPECGLTILLA